MVRKAKGTKKKETVTTKRIATPEEIINHCKSHIVDVYIPSMDACIRCQLPQGDAIYQMRVKCKSQDDYTKQLFRACLMDFSDKQIEKIEKSDGIRYMELFSAVMQNADLFTKGLNKDNIKN